jgi:hypothetical protein
MQDWTLSAFSLNMLVYIYFGIYNRMHSPSSKSICIDSLLFHFMYAIYAFKPFSLQLCFYILIIVFGYISSISFVIFYIFKYECELDKLFSDLLILLNGRREKGRMIVLLGVKFLYPNFDIVFK